MLSKTLLSMASVPLLVAGAPHLYARDALTVTHIETVVQTVYVTAYDDGTVSQPTAQPAIEVLPESSTTDAGHPEPTVAPAAPPPAVPTPSPAPSPAAPAAPEAPAPPKQAEEPQQPASPAQDSQTTTKADTSSGLARMSDAEVLASLTTCWGGMILKPQNGVINPCADVPALQKSVFARPDSKPDTLTVHNYCSYPVYYQHFAQANMFGSGEIAAGSSMDSPLSGTVVKVSKKQDMSSDVLIEYAVAGGQLYYDLSLITCLKKDSMDLSDCAGHEGGYQLGNAQAMSFQCGAGEWCDDQAYLYEENLCKKQNPVSSCSPSFGLTMEFCAGNK